MLKILVLYCMFINMRAAIGMNAHSVTDQRVTMMQDWLSCLFPEKSCSISPLAGDASFRRYFRVIIDQRAYVLMDAPPEKENCDAFIAIAHAFRNTAVRLPHLFEADLARGFLLLSDFGDQQLLPLLNAQSADALYRKAMDDLLQLQLAYKDKLN